MLAYRKSVLSYSLYYIYHTENYLSCTNEEMAKLFDIQVDEYINLMIKDFNAILRRKDNQLYYKSEKDVENAIDYINSILVSKKLNNY